MVDFYRKELDEFQEDKLRKKIWTETINENRSMLVHNLFSKKECDQIINITNKLGYENLKSYSKNYRNNLRVEGDNDVIKNVIWKRLEPIIPWKYVLDDESLQEDSELNQLEPKNVLSRMADFENFAGIWVINGINKRFSFL